LGQAEVLREPKAIEDWEIEHQKNSTIDADQVKVQWPLQIVQIIFDFSKVTFVVVIFPTEISS
jgi:hypothetical protein